MSGAIPEPPYQINGSCPCGAKFGISGTYWKYVYDAYQRWLAAHESCQSVTAPTYTPVTEPAP